MTGDWPLRLRPASALRRALAQREWRPRFVERMFVKQLLDGLPEKRLLTQGAQRSLVRREQRIDVLERGSDRILA
jgi:hypothetical protein